MEKNIKLKTPDNFIINGVLNLAGQTSERLIVFVHGFTGHMNEHFLYNAAQFFPQNEFDTFRFNLYDNDKNTRKLVGTTVDKHTEDLQIVFEYFRDKYKKIYAVGHSLGANVVVRAGSDVIAAAVLWEPSREPEEFLGRLEYSESLQLYIEHSNVDILVGKNFVEESKKLSTIKDFIAKFIKPLKIIAAELAGAKIGEELYFNNANKPKEYYLIKNSGHTFDEEGAETELFKETLGWFKKY